MKNKILIICTFLVIALTSIPLQGCNTYAQKDTILVGCVIPQTGVLAAMSKGTKEMYDAALKDINDDGGIYISEYGKKMKIEIVYADSESNPSLAFEVATKLISEDKIDIMIGHCTADTVNPVSSACERAGIPCFTVNAPADAWLSGGPYNTSYHAFFNTNNELNCFMEAWEQFATNKKVGVIASNDSEGLEISSAILNFCNANGYTAIETDTFEIGALDYTSIINELKAEECDIIVGVMLTDDFVTFWEQCHKLEYIPMVSTIAKACLFESDINSVGEDGLGSGVISEVWWAPNLPYVSDITGASCQDIALIWQDTFNESAPATCGYAYSNIEILIDILQRAKSLDATKLCDAAEQTDLDTVIGHIKFNNEHVSVMPLLTGQWIYENNEWTQYIVGNAQIPECELTGTIKILPGCTTN